MNEQEHLNAILTGRGLMKMPPIESEYGRSQIEVAEANVAGRHLVRVTTGPSTGEVAGCVIVLTPEAAVKLAQQIQFLAEQNRRDEVAE